MKSAVGAVVSLVLLAFIAGSAVAQESGDQETAIFAGGCFWCMEEAYEKVEGVEEAVSGYIGGHVEDPTYRQVTRGGTGHHEAVRVIYDPSVVTYDELVDIFWRNIDPVDDGGQFCDRGSSYLSGIFYQNDREERIARQSLRELEQSGRFSQEIATEISEAGEFYVAEEYHQDYYKKNTVRYRIYKRACGREARLNEIWG
jgi:peptide-methionine (S)-S-oxide reductase